MSTMICTEVSAVLFAHVAGRLGAAESAKVEAHLSGCAACAALAAEERAVALLLEQRLPRYSAPDGLRERLVRPAQKSDAKPLRRGTVLWGAALAALLTAAAVGVFALGSGKVAEGAIATEAVNDHLRVLYAERPIEIESGGIHQVKPWFTGRLDFAPVVAFEGDAEAALRGGAVGYFIDRKAAVFLYKVRLHSVSLFVFRADGLSWPVGNIEVGGAPATLVTSRGFRALLVQKTGLGYALVSDTGEADLVRLMQKILGT